MPRSPLPPPSPLPHPRPPAASAAFLRLGEARQGAARLRRGGAGHSLRMPLGVALRGSGTANEGPKGLGGWAGRAAVVAVAAVQPACGTQDWHTPTPPASPFSPWPCTDSPPAEPERPIILTSACRLRGSGSPPPSLRFRRTEPLPSRSSPPYPRRRRRRRLSAAELKSSAAHRKLAPLPPSTHTLPPRRPRSSSRSVNEPPPPPLLSRDRVQQSGEWAGMVLCAHSPQGPTEAHCRRPAGVV